MRRLLFVLVMLAACDKRPAAVAVAEKTAPAEEPESLTHWTRQTELFVEFPTLAAGKTSRFAIHLTRLDNFRAVRQGVVTVRVNGGTFRVNAPSRPGIFGVDVTPTGAPPYRLAIALAGEGIEDNHDLGAVPREAGPEEESISFLKEQQWALDFGTGVVGERPIRASLRVPAEVTPRAGGEAEVDAPFDGRLVMQRVPAPGARVTEGDVLAQLTLPPTAVGDPTALTLARDEADVAVTLAAKDRARAERLVAAGAAPARRLDEALAAEQSALARRRAAAERLALLEASTRAEGAAKLFALRAPVSGVVDQVKASPGANVKAGEAIFKLVDLDRVYVSAIVPESEFPRMRSLTGAALEVPGFDAPRTLGRLVTIGRVVDAPSRTFPVIYEVENRDRAVAVNQTVYVRLLFGSGAPSLAVPESAIVDDAGQPIVFVQVSGEKFARRAVKLGEREGGWVQAISGVRPGERIVTKGAHLIRLASLSSAVPAHGHVH